MLLIIIGNIIALIASLLMVYSGMLKEKEKILFIQSVQIGLSVLSNIVLGGITGAIINFLSLIRNIIYYYDRLKIKEKVFITIISVILTFKFNNLGLIGLLPLISTVSYTWLMDIKDVKKFKILVCFTMLMWFMYDLAIKSYTSTFFDFSTFIANIFVIIRINRKNIDSKKLDKI